MMFRSFRLRIVLLVALLVAEAFTLTYLFMASPSFFIPVTVVVVMIVTLVILIRYVERTQKDLTHFLLSIKQRAYTEHYPSRKTGRRFEELGLALEGVIDEFGRLNAEKEIHYQFLEALNEQINIAIVNFSKQGKLLHANTAAKKMFTASPVNDIDSFKRIDDRLYEAMIQLRPEQKRIVRCLVNSRMVSLSIFLKEIVLRGEPNRIFLIQNLNDELQEQEMEAWQQLMRVLTHEIMNSVTPIMSLAQAGQSILTGNDGQPKPQREIEQENITDLYDSLSTISSRSKGLLKFVQSYKDLSKSKEVYRQQTDLTKVVRRVIGLLAVDLENRHIALDEVGLDEPCELAIDSPLIEQVLINLIRNAMDAVANVEHPALRIILRKVSGAIELSIQDNGNGIDDETLSKVFVPFFTTKENGSGIGLSLSRQIMRLHDGNLSLQSSIGKGTIATIQFRI